MLSAVAAIHVASDASILPTYLGLGRSPRSCAVNNVLWLPLQDGNSALHLAACHGHTPVVLELLRAGADPTVRNKVGESDVLPLEACIEGSWMHRASQPLQACIKQAALPASLPGLRALAPTCRMRALMAPQQGQGLGECQQPWWPHMHQWGAATEQLTLARTCPGLILCKPKLLHVSGLGCRDMRNRARGTNTEYFMHATCNYKCHNSCVYRWQPPTCISTDWLPCS
jgi:hypothetical protein